MDDESMNRYEKQLYTVFKTFDVANEEALDKSAVNELCDALQLEDRGATLVNTLFERQAERVTFAQFRNGLLAVLGGASGEPPPAAVSSPVPLLRHDSPAQQSDDDSSGPEVAPKFIFGSKKYGRRSRPPRIDFDAEEPPGPRSSSASRLDTEDKRARQRTRCRRSVSAMESRHDSDTGTGGAARAEPFEHDRRIDRDEALALCRDLRMEGVDRGYVERIFEDAGTANTTVGEFFDRLNSSLTTAIEETSREARAPGARGDDGSADDEPRGAGLPAHAVVEAWARAGVQQPRRLLSELGFGAAALRPAELELALDAELRALADAPPQRALLLAAALALSRLRLERARRRAERACAERDKLRTDVVEANKRARLLAQEVDESHARIEADLEASVRLAERRQAEAARQVAAESAAERERAAAERALLESEVGRRAEAEARARAEAAALRERVGELEAQAAAAEERALAAERGAARQAAELRAELERGAAAAARAAAGALEAQLAGARAEAARLRDRNDELCAALEAAPRRAAPAPDARGGDLSTELSSILPPCPSSSPEGASSPASVGRGPVVPVDSVSAVAGSPAGCASPDAEALRREMLDRERIFDDEKQRLTGLIRELESGLEQMRGEYDKCEEYWGAKLDEERAAFGDLVAKIGEYERQFARLPAIDERHSLEAQVTDLEEEFAAYRRTAEAELRALRERGARGDARERAALRARSARAEAAVRRLTARLAAADALVTDLYVENCQLAHARARPL